jgi:undecaprenyl-diphosphatase
MNVTIFNFFFSFSSNIFIADFSMFLSYTMIYFLIIFAILAPIFIRRDFIYSFLNFVGVDSTWVAVYIVKNIFLIPRPFVTLNLTPLFLETGFSFPSSHVAVMAVLTVLIWKLNRKLGIVFLIFTILMGISRMVIGVHYPFDVILGGCLGMLIGLGIIWFYKKTHQFAFLRKYI